MAELQVVREGAASGRANELVLERIAGPETAAALGVPVGSIVDARHCVMPLDGSPATAEIVSPGDAAAIRNSWGFDNGKEA